MYSRVLIAILFLFSMPCIGRAGDSPKPATDATKAVNAAFLKYLPFSDRQDYEDAKKGFIAGLEGPIKDASGKVVWDLEPFAFLKSDTVPDTVNPSLWRFGQLNLTNGLFKVTDGIYQIRGFDLSNMTIVEGKTGIIIIDPLLSAEPAKAGLDLYYKHVDPQKKRPVVAVIYTHSHADHFGGVGGVTNKKDIDSGKVAIIAPEGFLEEAASENVFAGTIMSRRATYMYGSALGKGPQANVDAGLGKTTSTGTVTLFPPTDTIKKTGEKCTVDGVDIEFQMAPDTEAPAEMLIYFPASKALCAAEDACHTLHNLYTVRGAKVRDANKWWKSLDAALVLFGDRAEVLFVQHHWPRWGTESIKSYLTVQRNAYKYIHDQTLHLANLGYNPVEIGEMIKLPDAIAKQWFMRDYYGTLNHDAKAVYQMYLGWYDGNPANLHPLPPAEVGKRYVDMMGGPEATIRKAREYFAKGDYRFVSEVMKHVVFSDPNNQEAKNLLADSLEQQGYQSESGSWRPPFLTAAHELRNGLVKTAVSTASGDVVSAMSGEMLLAYLGVKLDAKKADGKKMTVNLDLTDTKEKFTLFLENSALVYRVGVLADKPDAELRLPKSAFIALSMAGKELDEVMKMPGVSITAPEKVKELSSMFVTFPGVFGLVTP